MLITTAIGTEACLQHDPLFLLLLSITYKDGRAPLDNLKKFPDNFIYEVIIVYADF